METEFKFRKLMNQPCTRTIDLLVIHCSATRCDRTFTGADVDAAHRARGFSQAGYHFYIRKDGSVEGLRPLNLVGAHARGYNARSIGICYEGGLDMNGKPTDTRTAEQRASLRKVVTALHERFPTAGVLGHRDLSKDLNHDGVIEKHEWIKVCPCFDVRREL